MIVKHIDAKKRRANRVRGKILGTDKLPRLSVFRSNKYIYVQAINDVDGTTLVASKIIKSDGEKKNKVSLASLTGELFASELVKKGIKEGIFDRGKFRYHGRVAALAEGIRKGGVRI